MRAGVSSLAQPATPTISDVLTTPPQVHANPEAEKVQAYPGFDWLRFALASIVVLGHSGFQFAPFLDAGLAVKIFFALSGWLIGGILLRTERKEMPRFFFNRATRIWIPYAVAILLLYSVAALKEGIDFFWLKYLLLDVTFTHQLYNFFPAAQFEMPMDGSGNQFWSIAVEEQFYLLAPIVMLFLPRGKSLLLWLPIAIVTLALDWNTASASLGVCAVILQRDYRLAEKPLARIAAALVAIGSAVAMTLTGANYITGPLFAVAAIVLLAMPGKRRSIALIAGGLSYPLYLNQWIASFAVNFIVHRFLPLGQGAHIILVYLVSILMALCLYWVIDRPIQLYRGAWYTPVRGRALGVIAYSLVGIGIVTGGLIHIYGPHGVVPPDYVATHE